MRSHLLPVVFALCVFAPLALAQDAAVDRTDELRAWKEVRRLELPPTAVFTGTSFSAGGIVICPLEPDKLGVFLAYGVETVPDPDDLRVAFVDKDGKRHAAWSQGYGAGGPDRTGIRAHLFVPLWIPLFLVGAATIRADRHDRRLGPGYCQACGYDLSHVNGDTCSECGTPLKRNEKER